MMCPKCGNRPLTFSKWLRTLNPFRIQCGHCGARLEAGPVAYIWTLCHVPIGIGLAVLGMRAGPWFFPVIVGVVFCTAYVIPYVMFDTIYRISSPAA